MRRWIFFLIACVLGSQFAYAEMEEVEAQQGSPIYCQLMQRTYIDADQLYIDETGIYVDLGECEWIQIRSLMHDEQGLFFMGAPSTMKAHFYWECPKCNLKNMFWKKTCEGCGYDPRKGR